MYDVPILIGSFDPADADQLGAIFFAAVRAAEVYTASPRRAANGGGADCRAALGLHDACGGRIYRPRVRRPDYQRRGIGRRLYMQIEALAREAKIDRLTTEASHLIRGLYEKHGWTRVREQRIDRGGVTLTNFVMEKHLVGPARD